jgi:hypothetical protein
MKVPFKKIALSLTGISTPVFGVSWKPPALERDIARKLIIFLEDRRALYNPFDIEMPMYVDRSIIEIRKELTGILKDIDEKSDLSKHVSAMRAACRKFLNQITPEDRHRYGRHEAEFFAALGELRAIFGIHIAQLCVKYGIAIEQELALILPLAENAEDMS